MREGDTEELVDIVGRMAILLVRIVSGNVKARMMNCGSECVGNYTERKPLLVQAKDLVCVYL